jgi:hypothetical protein
MAGLSFVSEMILRGSSVVLAGDYHEHLLGLVSVGMFFFHLVRGETVRVQIDARQAPQLGGRYANKEAERISR